MSWWKDLFESHQNARNWDAPRPENETVTEIQALFQAAREDAPAPDEKLWEKLRPQLSGHEGQAHSAFSFTTALAATGPRFAVAALGVLLIVASLFWSQGAERQMRTLEPQANLVVNYDRNPLNPILMIGNGLEAQTGQELLQYVVYGSSER